MSETGKTGSAKEETKSEETAPDNTVEFKKNEEANKAREEALVKLTHTSAFTLVYLNEDNIPCSIYSHSGISHVASRGMVNFIENLNKKIEDDLNKGCGLEIIK